MSHSNSNQFQERADFTWSDDSIRFINTPSSSARKTFFYVQETGYFLTAHPYFTERVNLNSFLIIYTISGKGFLKYRNNSYELLPGTTTFINCMEHHYYECPKESSWEFLWVHFNGTAARGYYEEFIKNDFRIAEDPDPFFTERTLRRILSLTQKKDLHSEIIISSLITELLTHLLIVNSSENLSLGFMPDYIKKILKKIDQCFQDTLSLDTLSDEFGISKFHMSREFKRYIGTTPNEYIILARINHAKELLKYTDKTVEEITFSCGFHNVSHFINQFKKHEKSTPLQYRKEWGAH